MRCGHGGEGSCVDVGGGSAVQFHSMGGVRRRAEGHTHTHTHTGIHRNVHANVAPTL